MFLYALTLQRATGIVHSIHGNFSGSKHQEIAVSRGSIIELLRPDANTGKIHTILTQEVFGVVRSMLSFRLTGGSKDFIVVGSDSGRIVILEYLPAKNCFDRLHLNPRSCKGGFIYVFRLSEAGDKLEFMHKTVVDEVPGAICPFQGRVLIGVGRLLRIYDLGKSKMLRKCENKNVPNHIVSIKTMGQRAYVADVQDSVFYVRYRRQENQLMVFADDINPRWVTSQCVLDFDTVAIADKFGNVSLLRLPGDVSDEVEEDPTGNKSLWDRGLLGGASQKGDVICTYHVGETILALQKATLIPGGSESLVYTTLAGGVGMLVPFTSHEDHDFFQHLEMHMRAEHSPLCGRDHLSYRSYYFPVKHVIDGDLCEQFNSLEPAKQKSISTELDRTPAEVSKKLEDIRTRYAF